MHIWDSEQFWLKACDYMQRSTLAAADEATEPLWAALALEMLARSALTSVHPVLNADPQDEGTHLLFAFGFESKKQPKSIPAHAVFSRLERIEPKYKEHRAVCDYLATLRNEELHSAGVPFASLDEQTWLAAFYGACDCLCTFLKRDLQDFLGSTTEHARELIAAARGEIRDEVKTRITSHRAQFLALSLEEQAAAAAGVQPQIRWLGGRVVNCPACSGSTAVLDGDLAKEARPVFQDDQLHVDRTYAVKSLRCGVCRLVLRSVAECVAANVRPRFVLTEVTDLHEIHEDEDGAEYDNM